MEPDDALADHVDALVRIHPPAAQRTGRRIGIRRGHLERGEVVREGVDPHVHDLGRIVRHGDAPPGRAGRSPRHADVVDARGEQGEDLVAA
jgi:hypothetical protein